MFTRRGVQNLTKSNFTEQLWYHKTYQLLSVQQTSWIPQPKFNSETTYILDQNINYIIDAS